MFFAFSSNLFLYRFLFAFELLLSEFLATYSLKKRKHFALRWLASAFCLNILVFFSPVFYDALISSLIFLIYFAFSILLLWFIYDERLVSLLFCGLLAYATQHICYEIYTFVIRVFHIGVLELYFGTTQVEDFNFMVVFVYLIVYSLVYWFVWAVIYYQIRIRKKLAFRSVSLLVLGGIIIIIDILLNSFVVYSSLKVDSMIQNILFVYSLSSYVLVVFFQLFLLKNRTLEDDLESISNLWKEDRIRFESDKKNFELLHIKCHDLKHQIQNIKASSEIDNKTLKDLEKAVNLYDDSIQCGNEALDILFFQKSQDFHDYGIQVLSMMDGKSLSFISDNDLYSLFDNAISNAIEALKDLKDPEKKIIKIKTARKNDFLVLHFENYLEKDLKKDSTSGLLQTTAKENVQDHGYGMKSMKYLAMKYNGEMRFSVQDHLFQLDFIFMDSSKKAINPTNEAKNTAERAYN